MLLKLVFWSLRPHISVFFNRAPHFNMARDPSRAWQNSYGQAWVSCERYCIPFLKSALAELSSPLTASNHIPTKGLLYCSLFCQADCLRLIWYTGSQLLTGTARLSGFVLLLTARLLVVSLLRLCHLWHLPPNNNGYLAVTY